MVRSFEDLDVFQRAYRLSLVVHRASLGFPDIEQRALGDQMRRASKSIPVNIAEGFGKQRLSKAEYRRYLMTSVGSADEMQVWCGIVLISDTLMSRLGSTGETSISRLPGCFRVCTRVRAAGAVLTSDS